MGGGSEDALQAETRQLLDLAPLDARRAVSALRAEPVDVVLVHVQGPSLTVQFKQLFEVLARD